MVTSVAFLLAANLVPLAGDTPASFAADIAPLLDRYCMDCHSGSEPEADFAIDRFANDGAGAAGGYTFSTLLTAIVTSEPFRLRRGEGG